MTESAGGRKGLPASAAGVMIIPTGSSGPPRTELDFPEDLDVPFKLTLLTVAGWLAFSAGPARACVCGPFDRLPAYPHVAFEGRLIEVRFERTWWARAQSRDSTRSYPTAGVMHAELGLVERQSSVLVLEVEAVYRGELGARVELLHASSSCSIRVPPVGTRWFVMPFRDESGALHIDLCTPRIELDRHDQTLAQSLAELPDDSPLPSLMAPLLDARDASPLERLWAERRREAAERENDR